MTSDAQPAAIGQRC